MATIQSAVNLKAMKTVFLNYLHGVHLFSVWLVCISFESMSNNKKRVTSEL